MAFDDAKGIQIAYEEAQKGFEEGGIPIDGTVLGRGHNMRVQKGSPTLHGEISCLENCGRLKASVYAKCTIPRLVMGENENFVGAEDWLAKNGVEVVNLQHQGCKELMARFIKEHPEEWNEDIGEP